jgi:hypothetical protein
MKRTARKSDNTNQQAIAYVRVSTSGQAEDGVSLDKPRQRILYAGAELNRLYPDCSISISNHAV